MCGIVGVYSGNQRYSEEDIDRALERIAHRGPDGRGIIFSRDRKAALGHNRLSMVGLKGGEQPFCSRDGNLIVTVNGELYDYVYLREGLERKGVAFVSDSDSELALHLYAVYGEGFTEYLRGEFAIIIWDEQRQHLIAVRDRFGIKPLYYNCSDGIALASEVKALFALGAIKPEWDPHSFYHICSRQYTLPDKSLFKGIKQLEPGYLLIANTEGISTRPYWDIDYSSGSDFPVIEEAISEFRRLLEDSVRCRLEADVDLCVHLSGGIDSTSVAAVMSQYQKVSCFTIGFEGSQLDEYDIARDSAEFLGIEIFPYYVKPMDLLQNLENAVYYSEGTGINGHYTAKYLLNQHIRKHGFKGALTGEGADELLGGYPHLREDLYAADQSYIERLHLQNSSSAGLMINADTSQLSLNSVEPRLGYIPSFMAAKAGLGHRLHTVLNEQYLREMEGVDCNLEFIKRYQAQLKTMRNNTDRSLYLWNKSCLPLYILKTLGDGCEMSASVEGRLPFLDHRLFEFCQRLPVEFKIRNGVEKFILREAMKDILPEPIYRRQKHPFIAPSLFSSADACNFVREEFSSKCFADIPYLSQKKALNLLTTIENSSEQKQKLWDPVIYTLLSALYTQKRLISISYG
jgi:asparagine synthase (glutamine-hydrolysing)